MQLPTRAIKTEKNSIITAYDASQLIDDYRELRLIKLEDALKSGRPANVLPVDMQFFESQGYRLPFVKRHDNRFLFPTMSSVESPAGISKCSEFYLVSIDLLVLTQDYHYKLAKHNYEKNPEYRSGKKRPFRKAGSNTMSWVQWDLSHLFYDTDTGWRIHKEAHDEIKQKLSDIKLNIDEFETTFSKGEYTSYGDRMLNDSLYDEYGVKAKRQNGTDIDDKDLLEIRMALQLVFNTFGDLSSHLRRCRIKISHAGDKHMHGRNHIGMFYPFFNAIGVSRHEGLSRTLAHEIAHFLDYTWGQMENRSYISDDYDSLAKTIAFCFRQNMTEPQSGEYQNRTKECFARALEQYFVQTNGLPLENTMGNFVDTVVYNEKIGPLVEDFLKQFHAKCK